MAGLATSGTLTHWFRDQCRARADPAKRLRARWREEAEASPPGADGLVMLPYFSGERTPIHDPHAKGVIFGLNLTHDRGDLYRALLEGIACGTNHIFETYREIGAVPKTLLAVGGGTKNRVWAQATSDVSGHGADGLRERPSAPATAMRSWRRWPSAMSRRSDIRAWNPEERRIVPDRGNRAVYERQYRIFKAALQQTKDLMAELS